MSPEYRQRLREKPMNRISHAPTKEQLEAKRMKFLKTPTAEQAYLKEVYGIGTTAKKEQLPQKTYLLYCKAVQMVKIGKSCDPLGRMQDLRTMNAAPVVPLTVLDTPEAELHERFASSRHHGEWFLTTHRLCDYLEEIGERDSADLLRLELTPDPAYTSE